jgi:ArsR family transcriptional regulator
MGTSLQPDPRWGTIPSVNLDALKLIDESSPVKGNPMTEKPSPSTGCCEPSGAPAAFPDDLAARARVFRALGEEARLRLLHLVRDDEICVCDLVAVVGMPQGTLSHHLGVLHQAGLVTARKQGRWNYYRATPLALATLDGLRLPARLAP